MDFQSMVLELDNHSRYHRHQYDLHLIVVRFVEAPSHTMSEVSNPYS